jgi:transposase-like protein
MEESLSFYRLPPPPHKHMKSTNRRERRRGESKRRPLVVRLFPPAAAGLRLVRALALERDETGSQAMQYLNREPLLEQKKAA